MKTEFTELQEEASFVDVSVFLSEIDVIDFSSGRVSPPPAGDVSSCDFFPCAARVVEEQDEYARVMAQLSTVTSEWGT